MILSVIEDNACSNS